MIDDGRAGTISPGFPQHLRTAQDPRWPCWRSTERSLQRLRPRARGGGDAGVDVESSPAGMTRSPSPNPIRDDGDCPPGRAAPPDRRRPPGPRRSRPRCSAVQPAVRLPHHRHRRGGRHPAPGRSAQRVEDRPLDLLQVVRVGDLLALRGAHVERVDDPVPQGPDLGGADVEVEAGEGLVVRRQRMPTLSGAWTSGITVAVPEASLSTQHLGRGGLGVRDRLGAGVGPLPLGDPVARASCPDSACSTLLGHLVAVDGCRRGSA